MELEGRKKPTNTHMSSQQLIAGAEEVAEGISALAVLPEDLGLTPSTHMVAGSSSSVFCGCYTSIPISNLLIHI